MEVSFDEEGVSVQLPSEPLRLEGGWIRLKLPRWGLELWGNPEDLAKLANLIIAGRLREEDISLLKTIGGFSCQRQATLVNMFVNGRYDILKSFIETTRTYDEFERRGFHYFEGSHQLLLVTGTLITFLENGGIKVGYAEIEKFNEWLQKGSVEDAEHRHFFLEEDKAILETVEKYLPQHAEAIRALRLISEFSPAKQERILQQMLQGPLPGAQLSKYKRDLVEREASREKRREYRRLAWEFYGNHHMYLAKERQELLIQTSYLWTFLLVKFDTDDCRVFEVEVERIWKNRKAYPDIDQIIGQWIKTGRMSRGRYVRVKALERKDILSAPYYEALAEVAEKLEEPYQSRLKSLLVFSKLQPSSPSET